MRKFAKIAGGATLLLGLLAGAVAVAQFLVPTVTSVGDADVFQDIVGGVPASTNKYALATTLGAYFSGATNGVNAQTAASYAIANGDVGKLITFCNASPVAVSLQASGTAGFPPGAAGKTFEVLNVCAGTVTITPNTSTIGGNATLVLNTGQGAAIFPDGVNYQAQLGGSGNLASNWLATGGTSVNFATATLGPTGAHSTVQEWLSFKDANGTVRYIPAF